MLAKLVREIGAVETKEAISLLYKLNGDQRVSSRLVRMTRRFAVGAF